ncbi:hypothetical protein HDV00_008523, partial [Rhizophlyctis rosea]
MLVATSESQPLFDPSEQDYLNDWLNNFMNPEPGTSSAPSQPTLSPLQPLPKPLLDGRLQPGITDSLGREGNGYLVGNDRHRNGDGSIRGRSNSAESSHLRNQPRANSQSLATNYGVSTSTQHQQDLAMPEPSQPIVPTLTTNQQPSTNASRKRKSASSLYPPSKTARSSPSSRVDKLPTTSVAAVALEISTEIDIDTNEGNSSADRIRRTGKELLTEEEKRANHIMSEQKRRNMIRIGFKQLTELVPGLTSGSAGSSKSVILSKTVEHIRDMEAGNRKLEAEIAALQRMIGDGDAEGRAAGLGGGSERDSVKDEARIRREMEEGGGTNGSGRISGKDRKGPTEMLDKVSPSTGARSATRPPPIALPHLTIPYYPVMAPPLYAGSGGSVSGSVGGTSSIPIPIPDRPVGYPRTGEGFREMATGAGTQHITPLPLEYPYPGAGIGNGAVRSASGSGATAGGGGTAGRRMSVAMAEGIGGRSFMVSWKFMKLV